MFFGGRNHGTYLGCLTCDEFESDSVSNSYGPYDSTYARNSVSNQFGEFGSRYSQYGGCNSYATDPPVIVDRAGEFYGRLKLNGYHPQASRDPQLLAWLSTGCAD